MTGVTQFARFVGVTALPSVLLAFKMVAWFDSIPEFNPFKYKSFPVNGGRQSWRVTQDVKREIGAGEPRWADCFVVTATRVSVRVRLHGQQSAIIVSLYAQLREKSSEVVLFDINRTIPSSQLSHASMRCAF
jgi:hypothetical protein